MLQCHLGGDYILGNEGFLCSDKFFPAINNMDDCRKSLSVIKLKYPGATAKIGAKYFNGRPKGCIFHLPTNTLLWNKEKNGGPNKEDRQVCRAKGKIETCPINYTEMKLK